MHGELRKLSRVATEIPHGLLTPEVRAFRLTAQSEACFEPRL